MKRRRGGLSRFTVWNDGHYGGGSDLEHRFGRCDWSAGIDGLSVREIIRLALDHARSCDGTPIVRKPATGGILPPSVAELWGPLLRQSIERSLVFGGTVSEPPATRGAGT